MTFFKLAGNCFDQLPLTAPPPPDHIVQVEMFWNSSTVWQTMTQTIAELQEEVADLHSAATELVQDSISSYEGDQLPGTGNRGVDHTDSTASDTLSQSISSQEGGDDDVCAEKVELEEEVNQQDSSSSAGQEEGLGQFDSPGAEYDDTPDANAARRILLENETTIRGYQIDKALLDQMDMDSRWTPDLCLHECMLPSLNLMLLASHIT